MFQIEDVGIGTRPQARLFYDAGNFVFCGGLEFIVLEFFAEFCPPAPVPLAEAPGPMALLRVLAKNPLKPGLLLILSRPWWSRAFSSDALRL